MQPRKRGYRGLRKELTRPLLYNEGGVLDDLDEVSKLDNSHRYTAFVRSK
jgi:hypothetical protein